MEKRKLKIDRPEISDNDILRYKDFNSVVNKVNATQGFNTIKFLSVSGIITIAAIALTFAFLPETTEDNSQIANNEPQTHIKPPIPELDVPYKTYSIDNSKDTTILTDEGSYIFIPANSFINENGETLENNIVEIKYREFHNPYDLFVSGIPMEYDSAGVDYTFETAGMLDILAFNNSQPLKLKDGKEIKIDMLSDNTDTDFNLYRYDDKEGEWLYKNKSEFKQINENNYLSNTTEPNIENTESKLPIKPILSDKNKYSFKVDVNNNENNFINAKEVLFEIDETQCEFKPEYFTVSWENIDISKIDENNYKLTLSKNGKLVDLVAYPVYDNSDYNNALKKYNKLNEDNKKQKREILSKRKQKTENNKILAAQTTKAFTENGTKEWSYRSISILALGIHNIDRPLPKSVVSISPTFVDEENNIIKTKDIYLVEKDKNRLLHFEGEKTNISVNTATDNVIWALTDDDRVVIADSEDANSINKDDAEKTFNVKTYDYIEGSKKVKDEISGNNTTQNTAKKITTKTFPNPFTSYVNISLSDEKECIVQLLNTQGQMLDNVKFYGKEYKWELSKYNNGAYIIIILIPTESYKKTFRIIKK